MKELVGLLSLVSKDLLSVIVALLLFFFILALKEYKKQLDKNINKVSGNIQALDSRMTSFTEELLKIQSSISSQSRLLVKDIADNKIQINDDINEAKIELVKINRAIKTLKSDVNLMCQEVNKGYGKVYHLGLETSSNFNKIKIMDEKMESLKGSYGKIKLLAQKNEKLSKGNQSAIKRNSETVEKVEEVFKKAKKRKV